MHAIQTFMDFCFLSLFWYGLRSAQLEANLHGFPLNAVAI